jgi:outer membrane lipoprotein carrier protein
MSSRIARLALAAFVFVARLAEAAPKVDEVVRRLQARYDETKDFTAEFVQAVDVESLGRTLESHGRVAFKRPGRMRWEFLAPEEQTIVADGETLWIYQPKHEQVLKAPFQVAFQSAMPVSFLLGIGRLAEDFDPEILSADERKIRLRLEPKNDADIGELVLTVDAKSYDVVSATVTDPLGNETRLTFTNLRHGVGLPDSTFAFEVPDGVDVVEAPGGSPPR